MGGLLDASGHEGVVVAGLVTQELRVEAGGIEGAKIVLQSGLLLLVVVVVGGLAGHLFLSERVKIRKKSKKDIY